MLKVSTTSLVSGGPSLFGVATRAALWLLLAVQAGCSEGTTGPQLVTCSGTVTYQGKPVANAEVLFIPADLNSTKSARSARGVTAAAGDYRLGTSIEGDGVIPGKYQVTITARGPGTPIPPELNPGLPPHEAFIPGTPLIPEKYFRPETSGLTADVPSKGSQTQNFALP